MRTVQGREDLQVIDYMTRPIVELVSHPDYNQSMMDGCIRISTMDSYEFAEMMSDWEMLRALSWDNRSKIRAEMQDLAKR